MSGRELGWAGVALVAGAALVVGFAWLEGRGGHLQAPSASAAGGWDPQPVELEAPRAASFDASRAPIPGLSQRDHEHWWDAPSVGASIREPEPALRLRVVDASTGLPLDRIDVLERGASGALASLLPTEEPAPKVLARGGRSPVSLEPGTFRRMLWVGAPGYAWGTVPRSALRRTREVELALVAAGAIDVRLDGYEAEFEGYLWLFERGHERNPKRCARVSIDDPGGRVIELLPPADYVVRVQQGESWNPVILAEETVQVRADETVLLRLGVVAPAQEAEKVPCAGAVVIPGGFPERHLRVEFVPGPDLAGRQPKLDFSHFLSSGSTRPAEIPFEVGPALPGRYTVRLNPLGGELELDLPDHGDRSLRLEYAALHEVLVFVGQGRGTSGEPDLAATIQPEGSERRGPARIEFDRESGGCRLSVPVGTLVMAAPGNSGPLESEPLQVRPGRNVFRVDLRPLSAVDVRVLRGGELVRVGGHWNSTRVTCKATGASRDSWMTHTGSDRMLLYYPFEGECSLDLRPVGGEFADLEPIDVFLRRGRTERVEVELTSER